LDQQYDFILILQQHRREAGPAAISEFISGGRHVRTEREHDVIWHDVIAALIFNPGNEVSPFEQGLEH
jgi:hypothetical protein